MILRLRLLTIAIDYLLLLGAFTLAYFFRVGFLLSSDFPFQPYFLSGALTAVAWIAALFVFRGYSVQVRFTHWKHLSKVFVAGLTGTAFFGLIFYFTQKALFSRLLLFYIFLCGTIVMTLFHLLVAWIEKRLIKRGYGNVRLLLIGSNRGIKSFIATLKKNTSRYIPVAILDGYGTSEKKIEGVPVLGKLNVLEEVVEGHRIDAIVQGDNIEQTTNIMAFCQQNSLDYFLLPYLLGVYQGSVDIQHLETPLISPYRPLRTGFFERLIG